MAKPVAPLLAFGASGQIAKTLVYGSWKGISYARRYVIPANPQSTEQTLTRTAFSFLQNVWKTAPLALQAAFNAYASSQQMTGRNAFGKFNIGVLRDQADLDLMTFSPGARSGLTATAIDVTPGDGTLTVDLTAPALPTGWSIISAEVVAIANQDPNTGTAYTIASGDDDATPWQVVLTGLTNDTAYRVAGWFTFLRPDGQTAYGASIAADGTPAA